MASASTRLRTPKGIAGPSASRCGTCCPRSGERREPRGLWGNEMTRICFLNPFGTDTYDSLIEETVTPSLRPGTELVIRHLVDYPANMDYFVAKHLAEVGVLRAVIAAERDGFDAFVIGCCYDPGLTQARELTSMPVVGPLEASVMLARLFGHRFSVVTDIFKAVPELEDRLRVYGLESNCRSVSAIDWF